MANSNVQSGFPHTPLVRLQSIQSEIDTFVSNEQEVVFEEHRQYGNSYAINLDSLSDSVLGEDVHTARIFPKKNGDAMRSAYAETTRKLDTHLIMVAKKMLELVLLGANLLVVFLVKFDLFCERILSKGSAYVQESTTEISRKKEMLLEELRESKAVKYEEAKEQVLTLDKVFEVQPVAIQSYDVPRRVGVQKPASVHTPAPAQTRRYIPTTPTPVHTPAPRPVYTPTPTHAFIEPASPAVPATNTPREAPSLSVFLYALSILYRELRFGKKN